MVQALKFFYREYPTSDYKFAYVREPRRAGYPMAMTLSEEIANALIDASPYKDRLPSISRRGLAPKGALRITHEDAKTSELWVYNHDGEFFLIMPPEED